MSSSPPPATLFLPGAGGRRAFWEPVAMHLARPWSRHLFYPWPGFGDAPSDPAIGSLDDLYSWWVARIPARPSDVVAQSMGGVLAMRLAIERPDRVRRLVLVATSGGTRTRFGIDWRPGLRAERAHLPDWFERDETQLDARLGEVRAPTLLVFGDDDPIAPVATGEYLRSLLRDARLSVVKGGTHMLAEERAHEVAQLIDGHLAR